MELKVKVLDEREILKIDQASRALLMEVGVQVPHAESLEIYKKAGAIVDFS
jgi:trimethylamine:corrinoid methyltransferase-like protein